jgi:hypothetical protein
MKSSTGYHVHQAQEPLPGDDACTEEQVVCLPTATNSYYKMYGVRGRSTDFLGLMTSSSSGTLRPFERWVSL